MHFHIISINRFVDIQYVLVFWDLLCLVENAKNFVQSVVLLTLQSRNLDDDAVVCQAVYKRVWQSLGHQIVVIVERLSAYIEYRFLDVSDFMS